MVHERDYMVPHSCNSVSVDSTNFRSSKICERQGGEMAEQVEAPATKPDNLYSILHGGAHTVEEPTSRLSCDFHTASVMLTHSRVYTCPYAKINKDVINLKKCLKDHPSSEK